MKLDFWECLKLLAVFLTAQLVINTLKDDFTLMFSTKTILEDQEVQIQYLKTENSILKDRLNRAVRLNKPEIITLQVTASGDTIIKQIPDFIK